MMGVVRRRLFWRIYLTLLASLVATIILMSTFFWFLGEAQREAGRGETPFGPAEVSLYAADGHLIGARGPPITRADAAAGRHWGPGHVLRLDLPGGGFVFSRFGPPSGKRALRFVFMLLAISGAVGLAAYPVTALLTRRLEALRFGVASWGDGRAQVRLDERGSDEVALLARTFNSAMTRLDALLTAQKTLLANASHELRSPLARLRLAAAGSGEAAQAEIERNLVEMDQLVDELLMSSRLDHSDAGSDRRERIDLLGLAAEEAARAGAELSGDPVEIFGEPILLRRLIRNLLENGMRHGRPPVTIEVAGYDCGAVISVSDRGPGIAAADRDRIFEPFYRPSGSVEASGGWGLGLALVRQIAERHGGSVTCKSGSRFVVTLKPAPAPRPHRL